MKETKYHCFYCSHLLDCPLNGKGFCEKWEESRIYSKYLYKKYKVHTADKLNELIRKNEPYIRIVRGLGDKYQYYRIKNKAP